MLTIGIDVGGTFTDLVAIDNGGRTVFAKSPSTPQDQSVGVMVGLQELAQRLGLSRQEMLSRTERIVHGTTVATNALLERKGAKVALLTTAGHRDVIEMREGLKGDRYNLRSSPPAPLVPRNLRFGVRERIGPQGEVIVPLDETSLDEAVEAIRASGATSVALCFLHSYSNSAHEIAAAERLARELPDVNVSRSSDVLPQIKEFERVSTTIVNAYVGPAVRHYLTGLEQRLATAGFTGSLFIILSHGGMAPVEEAWRLAAATVLSGPAGGISGSRRCAELLGVPDLVPFDMGGTSTDISLIADGRASLSADGGLADQRIALRSLDIASIAAGGGSIAGVDAGGAFRVGPESAGSVPGPACYGNGGNSPTVTDANLILGYLDAGSFMGGRRPLDQRAAEAALDRLAGQLGLTREKAAAGVFRLVNLAMADGIRLMTLKRGVDPRRFALLSFGGAAGIHAAEVARELEIKRIIIPTEASVLSAWGMLTSDLRYEVSRTHHQMDDDSSEMQVRNMYSALEKQAADRLRAWFAGPIRIERSAEMRYGEQVFEVDVPLSNVDLDSLDLIDQIEDRFHRAHEDLYTYSLRDEEVVLVNGRVAAVGIVARAKDKVEPVSSAPAVAHKRRKAFFNNAWTEVDVYAAERLSPGNIIHGPAIIEAETTTVIVNVGDRVTVNARRWLDIKVATALHAERELALSA
ncbi:hydantoinase/oxoprolinase family protein [Bradyrhizobium sp. ISRA443]|uniref:hydantoinase/oxoprolinase family protein n=1 Tax=unclassified Bradyrhizobium TaxID=2631580 RepID=UPI00247A058F|nr:MULTISPECIES: hydantoinase/oxoprolinase family protein [unclassified Bradyrhizobium]WGR92587.1 hydantoinase/oxoprolinase family protein [Bradyrhizobium sp. ISRA435]WGR97014.1 hydantoinase/oxoprolinase family protein [Bradyrhizobium sp. ISRA436]WGS03901.1 hydantoinase/oxoprolinase family protein [Bradyrhizobium sp. ISRA437]WGS10785.1 hydantoinase/oxoprolinase family protein [Bradyrhizobium sp. ISRA443]